MRVLAYLMSYPPMRYIGSELMTSRLLEALVDAGHEVVVAVDGAGATYTRRGVQVVPRRVVSTSQTAHKDYNLLVTHPEIADMIYARVKGTPYVAIVHNSRDMVRTGLHKRRPAYAVFNSEQMAEELAGDYERLQWSVIRPPVVFDAHVPTEPYARQFVTAVNLTVDKGANTFWWLAQQRPDVQFLAVLGGYGEQLFHDDRPNVWVAGQTPHLAPVFAQTRVLLVPSKHESYGMTAVEAAAAGCAVVASDLPGPREALGDAALYADPEDREAWLAALDRALADPEPMLREGKALRDRVTEQTRQGLRDWVALAEALARS